MKHLSAAPRAAPLQGLLAAAALHALAANSSDAKTAKALKPAATDLDTGQPQAIDLTTKAHIGSKYRDSAGPPIGYNTGNWRKVGGTSKAQNGDYHRRGEAWLN